MAVAELRVPPLAEQVRTVRLVVGAAARRLGLDEETQEDVRLAVGEAAARAVRRHLAAGIDDDVVVTMDDAHDRLTVAVQDRVAGDRVGVGGDGDDRPGLDEDALALALVVGLADSAERTAGPGGERIRLVWEPSGS